MPDQNDLVLRCRFLRRVAFLTFAVGKVRISSVEVTELPAASGLSLMDRKAVQAMCRMFVELKPERYRSETRSVRLGGHATSVRLEAAFWNTLEDIAAVQGLTLGRFLSKLHDEILDFQGEVTNFTSLLRCACLTYTSGLGQRPDLAQDLAREVAHDLRLMDITPPLRKLALR